MVEEVLEPDLPIIDPHHHLWDLRPLLGAVPEPRHPFVDTIAGAPYYTSTRSTQIPIPATGSSPPYSWNAGRFTIQGGAMA